MQGAHFPFIGLKPVGGYTTKSHVVFDIICDCTCTSSYALFTFDE